MLFLTLFINNLGGKCIKVQKILSRKMIFSFENEICFLSSILMISEGSCDSADSSNGAENSALRHINKIHLNIFT